MLRFNKRIVYVPSLEERQRELEKEEEQARKDVSEWADTGKYISAGSFLKRQLVLFELLRRARHEVLVFIDQLDPEIFGTPEFIREAFEFFDRSRPDGCIQIIEKTPHWATYLDHDGIAFD